MLPAVKKTYL